MDTTMQIELSPDQQVAYDGLLQFARESQQGEYITLGGLAGTGKSTLIAKLKEDGVQIQAILAPTGKAAQVIRSKGWKADTVHSAIYHFEREEENPETGKIEPVFSDRIPDLLPGDLVVIDESSMINEHLAHDIFKQGWRIIFVGDHGQLPPVGDDPGIMSKPDLKLETVHRQAEGSPIVKLAHCVRTNQKFQHDELDTRVRVLSKRDRHMFKSICLDPNTDQIICGFNKDRHAINKMVRESLGHAPERLIPNVGEKIICLRNNKHRGLFNGMIFEVVKDLGPVTSIRGQSTPNTHLFHIKDESGRVVVDAPIWINGFCDYEKSTELPKNTLLFDFGYAITCHKSQGSQWDSVAILDSPCDLWDNARWRYTAITRAAERVAVFC